jgi:hypothetical protein
MKANTMKTSGRAAFAALAVLLAGCTGYQNPLLSSGPVPRVEDCAFIQQATPTKYVCDGKTYTSTELNEIRSKKKSAKGTSVASLSAPTVSQVRAPASQP